MNRLKKLKNGWRRSKLNTILLLLISEIFWKNVIPDGRNAYGSNCEK